MQAEAETTEEPQARSVAPATEIGAEDAFSPADAERRLRAVARIWVNGAVRAVLAARAASGPADPS
jgi:hypothetical protein